MFVCPQAGGLPFGGRRSAFGGKGGLPSEAGGLHPGGLGRPPPPDTWDTTGFGQQAGGTHLT